MKKKSLYEAPHQTVSLLRFDSHFCLSGNFASDPDEQDQSGEDWGYEF